MQMTGIHERKLRGHFINIYLASVSFYRATAGLVGRIKTNEIRPWLSASSYCVGKKWAFVFLCPGSSSQEHL